MNLAPYMANLPTFDLGATFDIVNGAVASLPGMIFGTSEMTFDPNSPNGFDNPDPYTGAGYVLSEHANTVTTPEPHSLILFITIVAMLGIKIRNLYCVEPKSQPALAPASNLRVLNRAHA